MGLDIYFHKTSRTDWNNAKNEFDAFKELPEEEQDKMIEDGTTPGSKFDPSEVGYFRKVNFLMPFFDYKGNCEYKEIPKEKLLDLRKACIEVAGIKPSKVEHTNENGYDRVKYTYSPASRRKCAKILPTKSGFFFGSTDYDEWYFLEVKEVLAWVDGVLDDLADDEVILMYCWW